MLHIVTRNHFTNKTNKVVDSTELPDVLLRQRTVLEFA